ncbi:hypothetical protein CfE428DRAFT_3296 [Chthoniobacter flavus Ellin428]|uniref:Uncharacterized protein n=1 Tax=Chthoniobacter flavus Ellin428 TaxID=497964 RepID=B4D308_9BACT|nr:hypothetical protein [Chthoniobacter flavus]EDY19119.1 hypothetical protein CfE428DRAFT_3296 [Chthoniobacter flavus Ellin428]
MPHPGAFGQLTRIFPAETSEMADRRPLLRIAVSGNLDELAAALDAEVRAEMAKDRVYWEPLKREFEAMRFAEARGNRAAP